MVLACQIARPIHGHERALNKAKQSKAWQAPRVIVLTIFGLVQRLCTLPSEEILGRIEADCPPCIIYAQSGQPLLLKSLFAFTSRHIVSFSVHKQRLSSLCRCIDQIYRSRNTHSRYRATYLGLHAIFHHTCDLWTRSGSVPQPDRPQPTKRSSSLTFFIFPGDTESFKSTRALSIRTRSCPSRRFDSGPDQTALRTKTTAG